MAKGELKVFSVQDAESGEIQRLVEAATETEVRRHLLKNITLSKPTALTVSRCMSEGIKLEKAAT